MGKQVPWFLRLPRAAVARRDVIVRLAKTLHRTQRVDPEAVTHAFAFKCDELAFARTLLTRHPRYWLFRTHQQRRCGDFAVVDMSPPDPALRTVWVVELKRAEPVRAHRGAGLQLAQADDLGAALAAALGIVPMDTVVAQAVGDGRALAAWFGEGPRAL